MLLLRVVEKQAELHPLAGKLAIGERAETGEDRGNAGFGRFGGQCRTCIAAVLPLCHDVLEVRHQ